ncbi:hypothetical protein PAXINDRAFT_157123 [Paxillus involutus ATCC 200175]|uniref:TOG domain-containing protein n=1 Tax=Paxillus involutus ATCC 200175 TaxID=664439 RepID=A0A0C9ST72_PAXIN|nr:hypothetical protein PAXINDRAFT_157123 [Paxillus involutus ATCC 200175]
MDDQDLSEDRVWRRDHVFHDWQNAIRIVQTRLLSSSTKIRLQFLQDDLLWLVNEELTLSQIMDVFKILTHTYPRYVDTASRDAVEAIGMRLIEKDESSTGSPQLGVLEQVLGWLANEVSHISKRGSRSSQTPLAYISLLSTAVDVTIRLKDVKDESLKQIPPAVKNALYDFIRTCVGPDDLLNSILPTMEKALLRSPEYSLSVISDFLLAYYLPLDTPTLRKLLTATLNSAKSSNPIVRTNASALFKVLLPKVPSEFLESTVSDVLALPLAGKTTGADHRTTLYTMLSMVPTSDGASMRLVKSVPALMVKETNDVAISLLARTLHPHLTHPLRQNTRIPTDIANMIAKEMNSPKPVMRRAFVGVVGSVLWDLGEAEFQDRDALKAFATAVMGALEGNLKTVTANPLGAAAGPLEGTSADVLIGTPTKPSFLIWDKVYQKINDAEEELWLLRAAELAVDKLQSELLKNQHLRIQLGSVFIHLSVHSQFSDIRRRAGQTLELIVSRHPQLLNLVLRDALTFSFTRPVVPTKSLAPATTTATSPAGEEQEKPAVDKKRRYATLLSCCASVGKEKGKGISKDLRDSLLADLVVLAHHPMICGPSRLLWIELCRRAGADPHDLVSSTIDLAMKNILEASAVDAKFGFAEASYRAVGTLAFVCPEVVLPRIMDQLRLDVDGAALNGLTEDDLAIWETPEGTTYVDVLSSQKQDEGPKKGKDADIAKWEAELRKSLASKKGAIPAALSKQAQALVQAQLKKEALIRQRVSTLQSNLVRGLAFIRSIVNVCATSTTGVNEVMKETRGYVRPIAELLLDGAIGEWSVKLVGECAFETFVDLARCCSGRVETLRKWVGVAILRALEVPCVPEEVRAEPLDSLVLRVLYRLRTLSEQAPFDAATFSYAFLLLGRVIRKGGVNVSEDEEALEQVALVLDVIKFHRSEFSDVKFPRKAAIEHVLHVVRHQPRLSKEASSVLIDLGEAIQASATRDEVGVLIDGTLFQETHVRNSCLQALQPFDLTDFDWSPELWVACHDDDEQNARLANHVWDDNGLDVPEDFVDELLGFLGHDNAYVRVASAAAIAEAVEHHPQASEKAIVALQALYREKAKILAPEFDQYGMVIAQSLDRADPWPTRVAIALAFEQLAPPFPITEVESFFNFLIRDEALGDRSPEAGTAVVDHHGASRLAGLLSTFENHLAGPSPANETGDQIKEAVVILFGRAARHLEASDKRIPSIVDRLVEALKTPAEQVQMAVSDCLVPLVKLMGERSEQLMDHLFDELFNAPKYAARRGAAYGLAGAIKGLGIGGMKQYDVVNRLRAATEDKKRFELRQGALFAFETLSSTLGRLFEPYITFILPLLLTAFGDGTADVREAAQDAARVRATTVFPVLIPTLIATPMSVFNARALASLVTVAGNALSKRLTVILNALVKVLEDEKEEELLTALDEALRALLGSIEDPEGLNTLMLLLLGWTKNDAPKRRSSACFLFSMFCEESDLDASLYRVDWVRQLITLFDDREVQVHTNAWQAFDTFVKSVPKDELEPLVVPLRRTIEGTGAPGQTVPGFSLPKGVGPTVPIIIAGLTTGSNEQRENAAYAIGDLVERTEESAIKPFVVPFTGPLIRVATQATTYPPGVKTAILSALASMLERIPNHVKPFFPQLQRTFVKSVGDPASIVVRTRAADALGILMRSQPRVDPVVTELIGGARGSEEEIAASFILALSHVVRSAGVHGGIGDKVRETCVELVHESFRGSHEDHYMQAVAGLVASLSANPQSLKSVVNAYLVSGTPASALCSHTILAVLQPEDADYRISPDDTLFAKLGVMRSVALKVRESAANERPAISRPARDAREVLKEMAADGDESLAGIF